jgi:hypothetical protein
VRVSPGRILGARASAVGIAVGAGKEGKRSLAISERRASSKERMYRRIWLPDTPRDVSGGVCVPLEAASADSSAAFSVSSLGKNNSEIRRVHCIRGKKSAPQELEHTLHTPDGSDLCPDLLAPGGELRRRHGQLSRL